MVRAALALIGFTAVIAQIVLMRELIVVFNGNEISLGVILANWLLWTAVGGSLLGRLGAAGLQPRRLMAGLQALIAAALPVAILLVRASRSLFQPAPGEILGPGPMFLTSLAALSVFCMISGWLFAAGSRLYASEAGASTSLATSSVYLLEALGSGAGGLLASVVLIRYLTAFDIAGLLTLVNLISAASLGIATATRRRVVITLIVVFALPLVFFGSRRLERFSLEQLWHGFRLIATRNSVYGNLVLAETEGSRTLFENGLVVFTVPDPAAAEEAVHYALLQHASPTSLLLVGGGVSGSLAQALQHPSLTRIDYVELDPTVLDLADQHFASEWPRVRADPRVRVHNLDGRRFLKTTDSRFDVIIINLPEPQTAQLNRFYTREFFQEAAEKLTPDGLLSFQLRGGENYISPELGEFLRCINRTLAGVFADVTTIPGETVHFFAAKRGGVLLKTPEALLARLRTRQLRTEYVREYYLPFRMMPDRMRDLETQVRPRADTPINRDFAPIAYYFDVALWSTRFNRAYRELFQSMARVSFGGLALAAGLFLLVMTAARRLATKASATASAELCVAAMGFTLIGLEVLLLLGFQAIYGYVYHQLAVVIAGFMVGMALGSWWALRNDRRSQPRLWVLAILQLVAALSPIVLYALLLLLAGIKTPAGLFVVSQIVFPALALLCGLMGGYQFPVASGIFFSEGGGGRSPGALYAIDLVGACVGAILLSAYWVPVFGFRRTAVLMGVVNCAPAALALISASERWASAE